MPGPLFHLGGTAICLHGGQVTVASTNARVLVNGLPVATLADMYPIAGCAFSIGGKPQPCMRVQWLQPANRVFVNGQPAIVQLSSGLCLSAEQAPQGPPLIVACQTRVIGI